jgi:hypothetical protein
MVVKAAMAMMRTLLRGKRVAGALKPSPVEHKSAGYVLLDAALSLFITAILLVAVFDGARTVLRLSATLSTRAERVIAERNGEVVSGALNP